MNSVTRLSLAATLAVAWALAAHAQAPQAQRVAGTIEAVTGPTLTVKTHEGEVKVNIADNVMVFGVERRTLADIKPGQFLGVECRIPESVLGRAPRKAP
jgi:hypothetical protein